MKHYPLTLATLAGCSLFGCDAKESPIGTMGIAGSAGEVVSSGQAAEAEDVGSGGEESAGQETGQSPEQGDGDQQADQGEVASSFPPECRSQCELPMPCDENVEEFPGLHETLDEWSAPALCDSQGMALGTCADGTSFIFAQRAKGAEVRYFDGSGDFVGMGTKTDTSSPPCMGESYWPEPVLCEAPTVTEVLCDGWPIREPIRLPWAEGRPSRSVE